MFRVLLAHHQEVKQLYKIIAYYIVLLPVEELLETCSSPSTLRNIYICIYIEKSDFTGSLKY
jgi:hypothetical protein